MSIGVSGITIGDPVIDKAVFAGGFLGAALLAFARVRASRTQSDYCVLCSDVRIRWWRVAAQDVPSQVVQGGVTASSGTVGVPAWRAVCVIITGSCDATWS